MDLPLSSRATTPSEIRKSSFPVESTKKQGCKALASQYQTGVALRQAKQAIRIFSRSNFYGLDGKANSFFIDFNIWKRRKSKQSQH